MFGPFHDVITRVQLYFSHLQRNLSIVGKCSKEEEYVTTAPNSTQAA